MKHVTGAATSVQLAYGDDLVSVTIENAWAPGGPVLHDGGGGYGLRGIGERLALLGGDVEAGRTPEGWRVRASVPVAGPAQVRQRSDAR